jgi:hypothetical protein
MDGGNKMNNSQRLAFIQYQLEMLLEAARQANLNNGEPSLNALHLQLIRELEKSLETARNLNL